MISFKKHLWRFDRDGSMISVQKKVHSELDEKIFFQTEHKIQITIIGHILLPFERILKNKFKKSEKFERDLGGFLR